MIRLQMKKYYAILKQEQQKYKFYHQVKLMNMNFLQVKKSCPLIKVE